MIPSLNHLSANLPTFNLQGLNVDHLYAGRFSQERRLPAQTLFQPQVIIPFTGFSESNKTVHPSLPVPWKQGSFSAEIPIPPTTNSGKKETNFVSNTRTLSVDQETIESEGKSTETTTQEKDLIPTSLVFNIRRYSK